MAHQVGFLQSELASNDSSITHHLGTAVGGPLLWKWCRVLVRFGAWITAGAATFMGAPDHENGHPVHTGQNDSLFNALEQKSCGKTMQSTTKYVVGQNVELF